MALEGLFANPVDIRRQRLDALQQQRAQMAGMGGSMAGLLGQVAGGGNILGQQLAEGIARTAGLKTAQEVEAEKNQAMMRDVMSGNLNKMKRLRENLSGRKDVDPRVLAALDERITTAEDRQRSIIDRAESKAFRERQEARAEEASQLAQDRFAWTKQQAADALARQEAEDAEVIAKRNNQIKMIEGMKGADAYIEPLKAGLLEPGDVYRSLSEANQKDLVEIGNYNDGTNTVVGAIDKKTGTVYIATSEGWAAQGADSKWAKGKLEAVKTTPAKSATAQDVKYVTSVIKTNPTFQSAVEAMAPVVGSGFFSEGEPDQEFVDNLSNVIANAAKQYAAKNNVGFQEAVTAVGERVIQQETAKALESQDSMVDLTSVIDADDEEAFRILNEGGRVRRNGRIYQVNKYGYPVDVTDRAQQEMLGGNTMEGF